jgi:hypothetical protein
MIARKVGCLAADCPFQKISKIFFILEIFTIPEFYSPPERHFYLSLVPKGFRGFPHFESVAALTSY